MDKVTDTVARTLTDTLLYFIFLTGASVGKQGSRGIYEAFEQAHIDMRDINYDKIKRALANLVHDDLLLRSKKRSVLDIQITKAGLSRINEAFPYYRTNRPWDEHIYLISYDIPETANAKRNTLREYIQKTGGARLQDSLWINPYNPQELLEKFTRDKNINGTILVSKLGRDGAIGNESLSDLLRKTYHFDELTTRYNDFIHRRHSSRFQLALHYQNILADDPQLPFELEPKGFPAKRAYEHFLNSK
jgi:DNA-binding transcriptional regulator PaaX